MRGLDGVGGEHSTVEGEPSTAMSEAAAHCPRCDYDLRTAIRSWTDRCPIDGRCTECGLTFPWAEFLNRAAMPPRWNVEYCRERHWPQACAATLLNALLAWRLWRRVRMSMEWRPKRLVMFLLSLLLAMLLVPWLGNGLLAARFWWRHRDAADLFLAVGDPTLPPRSYPAGTVRGPSISGLLLESLFLPLASSSKVTVVVDGHELPLPAPRDLSLSLWSNQARRAGPESAAVEWHPMFNLRGASGWRIQGPRSPTRFYAGFYLTQPISPSPDTLMRLLLPSLGDGRLVAQCIQMASMVAIFALLPTTRRRHRVRWQHIGRTALYSLAFPLFTLTALAPATAYALALWDSEPSDTRLVLLYVLAVPAYCTVWWTIAIRNYLRMPHALATATLAAVGGWMVSATIFWEAILFPLVFLLPNL